MNNSENWRFVFIGILIVTLFVVVICRSEEIESWNVMFCRLPDGIVEPGVVIVAGADTVEIVLEWMQPAGSMDFDLQPAPVWVLSPDLCEFCFGKCVINNKSELPDSAVVRSEMIVHLAGGLWQVAVRACKPDGLCSQYSQPVILELRREKPPHWPVEVLIKIVGE